MDSNQFKILISQLKGLNNTNIPQDAKEYLTSVLTKILPYLPILIDNIGINSIYRATINRNVIGTNSRIQDFEKLSYPKPEFVRKYGRCNYPNEPVFYGSIYRLVNYSELKPREGDIVTLSTWKVKNQELNVLPIFPRKLLDDSPGFQDTFNHIEIVKNSLSGKLPFEREQVIQSIDFLSAVFEKEVDRDFDSNYLISAILSKLFFERESFDAIFYSSVQADFPYSNLAIKHELIDNKTIELEKVEELVLARNSGEIGGYISYLTGKCETPKQIQDKESWRNFDPPIDPNYWENFKVKYSINFNR